MPKNGQNKLDSNKTSRTGQKGSSVSRSQKKTADKIRGIFRKFFAVFLKDEAGKNNTAAAAAPKTKRMSGKREKTTLRIFPKKFIKALKSRFGRKSEKGSVTRASNSAGRKAKKRRLYFAYAGAGLAVIAIVLTLILVPNGQAKDTAADADEQDDAVPVYAALADAEPTPTPIITTLPEMTRPEASSNPVGVDAGTTTVPTDQPTTAPTQQPTQQPTTAPTEQPTPTPTPIVTTTPAPSPSPTPSPTPTAPPVPSYDLNDLVEEFRVEADKYYNEMGYSNNYYEFTEEEVITLAIVIYKEAKGEPEEGRIAVGNVVMNRVLNTSGAFNDTIYEVVTRPNQFAYSDTTTPNQVCIDAARKVLEDQVWTVSQDVYFFKSGGDVGDDWGTKKFYKRIEHHNFYTYPYSGRCTGKGIPPALFNRTYEWPRYGCKPSMGVWYVQSMLASLGYDVSPDKYFGKGTEEALEKFQADNGLTADGVAGPSTLSKLISKYGVDKFIDDFMD